MEKIKIKCKTNDTLELAAMKELQGKLKTRTNVDFDKIKLSILKYGFSFPFFVWREKSTNWILDGHGRFATLCKMQKEGYEIPPLPIVYVECATLAEAKNKLLRLNSHYGRITKESVIEFAEGIDLNYDEISLFENEINFSDVIDDSTSGDDEVPEVQGDPVSKPGEIYRLGNSYLMCGSATSPEDLKKLMGDAKADLIITDPPYGVNYLEKNIMLSKVGKSKNKLPIKSDDQSGFDIWRETVKALKPLAKEGAAWYVWHADIYRTHFVAPLEEQGIPVRQILIWNKNKFALGRCDYQYSHEPCIYAYGKNHSFYGGRTQWSVINCKAPAKCDLHPTMKPVELIEYQIKMSSKAGDLVVDVFGGSGTTLIAAEKNNRQCRMMEVDPVYCDVIRKRYTAWAKENGHEITDGCLD